MFSQRYHLDHSGAMCEVLDYRPWVLLWEMRVWRGRMTHLGAADRDILADDISCSGGLCTHRSFMFFGLFPLCFYLCVDLPFLRNEIICVFICLEGIRTGETEIKTRRVGIPFSLRRSLFVSDLLILQGLRLRS